MSHPHLDRPEGPLKVAGTATYAAEYARENCAEGVLVERRVRTGLSNWEHAEVLDGLEAGEQVVSSLEREGVRPGVLARVEPAASGARP